MSVDYIASLVQYSEGESQVGKGAAPWGPAMGAGGAFGYHFVDRNLYQVGKTC